MFQWNPACGPFRQAQGKPFREPQCDRAAQSQSKRKPRRGDIIVEKMHDPQPYPKNPVGVALLVRHEHRSS